jgi:hypothetical protein
MPRPLISDDLSGLCNRNARRVAEYRPSPSFKNVNAFMSIAPPQTHPDAEHGRLPSTRGLKTKDDFEYFHY